MKRYLLGWVIVSLGSAAMAAAARPPEEAGRSEALRPLLDCRAVPADAERLACYDRAVRSVLDAAARRDIVVVDSNAIRKVRRSLFGFGTPSLGALDGGRADEPAPAEISSTVRSARRDGDGSWLVTLEDGAVWRQTGGQIGGGVRPGEAVVVRRAALGSYFLRIGNRPGVKARREG